jgi:hypothetical protein
MPEDSGTPTATTVLLFVHSGSVIADGTTGQAGGDIIHAYVNKMLIFFDAKVQTLSIEGADADGSVYDLIVGG